MSKPKQIEVVDAGFMNQPLNWAGAANGLAGGRFYCRIPSLSVADEAQQTWYDSALGSIPAGESTGMGVAINGETGTNDQSEESEGVLVEYQVEVSCRARRDTGVYPHPFDVQLAIGRGPSAVVGSTFWIDAVDWFLAPNARWSVEEINSGATTNNYVVFRGSAKGVVNLRDTNLGVQPDEDPLVVGLRYANQDGTNAHTLTDMTLSVYVRRWYEDLRNVQPGN